MEYFCKTCKKKYASYQSLWNHNNTFHKDTKTDTILKKPVVFVCKTCKQEFTNRQTKWRHEKKCFKPNEPNNIITKVDEIETNLSKIADIQSQTLQLLKQIIQPQKSIKMIKNK